MWPSHCRELLCGPHIVGSYAFQCDHYYHYYCCCCRRRCFIIIILLSSSSSLLSPWYDLIWKRLQDLLHFDEDPSSQDPGPQRLKKRFRKVWWAKRREKSDDIRVDEDRTETIILREKSYCRQLLCRPEKRPCLPHVQTTEEASSSQCADQ